MSRVNSLLGQTFNRLTVLRQAESSPQGRARWVCQCDCGNITGPVLGYELTSGGTKSCGCLKSEVTTARNTTHGLSSHPAYWVYVGAEQRCINPKSSEWERYGGRGIKFEFKSFEEFWEAFGSTYQPGLTLERENTDGPYSKDNCRWATLHDQNRNKRNNVWLEFRGVTKIQADWAVFFGVSNSHLHKRLKEQDLEPVFESLLRQKGLTL